MSSYLSTRQVAEQLQVSPNTVKKWWREGRLKGVQLSPRKLRFRAGDVQAFLSAAPAPIAGRSAYRWEEFAWRAAHSELIASLQGQWLVVEGSRLVAHGPDPVRAVDEARAAGVAVPYVFYVPHRHNSASESLGL